MRSDAEPNAGDRGWRQYLTSYHDERPGITERLLASVEIRRASRPYAWQVEPLLTTSGVVLDLACGSAPTRPLLRGRRWLGVDLSAGELAVAAAAGRGPVVRGSADRLPLAAGVIDGVSAAMCLPVLTPLDLVLAEVKRVLRPGGVLVALVPSGRLGWNPSGWYRWWRVLRELGVGSPPWPNPRARDHLPAVLSAHGFVVGSVERRVYRYEIADAAAADLLVDGLYLPDVDPARVAAAKRALAEWASPGRRLPMPLCRVVAHVER